MTLRKDNWSHWEDEAITETVLEFAKQKKSASAAFEHLAIVIPTRTAGAISGHWYSALRAKVLKLNIKIAKAEETKEEITVIPASVPLKLDEYVKLLTAINLTPETIELINFRIRSLI